jgi:hypothetical protein
LPAPVVLRRRAVPLGLTINVQMPVALAGAGRINVTSSSGRASNAVELVALPNRGRGLAPR